MIEYSPFWKTLKQKDISTYTLINEHRMSSSTLSRLRHNKPISTVTLNDLCRILNCSVDEVATYVPNENDQKL